MVTRIARLLPAFFTLLMSASPGHAAEACAHPGEYLKPIMATHTPPPYPEMSQMTGEEGPTILQIVIGKDGIVTDSQIFKSSGSLRLDQAAQDFVKMSWRWEPPMFDCQPRVITTHVQILWRLRERNDIPPGVAVMTPDRADYPPDALARREQGVVALALALSVTGDIQLTRVQGSSGFPSLDDKALELAKSRKWTPAQMNGQAVPTVIELAVQWKLPDSAAK